jgi:hypothetical protein
LEWAEPVMGLVVGARVAAARRETGQMGRQPALVRASEDVVEICAGPTGGS